MTSAARESHVSKEGNGQVFPSDTAQVKEWLALEASSMLAGLKELEGRKNRI